MMTLGAHFFSPHRASPLFPSCSPPHIITVYAERAWFIADILYFIPPPPLTTLTPLSLSPNHPPINQPTHLTVNDRQGGSHVSFFDPHPLSLPLTLTLHIQFSSINILDSKTNYWPTGWWICEYCAYWFFHNFHNSNPLVTLYMYKLWYFIHAFCDPVCQMVYTQGGVDKGWFTRCTVLFTFVGLHEWLRLWERI